MPRLVIRDLCHPSPGLRVIDYPDRGRWGLDHPAPTTHENCIFAGPGIAAPLRRGELRPRRERTKFPSIGGVAACRRGG